MSDPTIVCILGMHRSGTSLLARVLNLLGVYLGPPKRLLPAAPENPRGFWEYRPILELNNEILARLGGDALDPPPLPLHWQNGVDFADLRQAAQAVIRSDFASVQVWGWKDPRTCLTLPFWQQVLPPMRYVLSLRNPLDVARSLERRDRITTERAIHLWLTHLRLTLMHTAQQPRTLICYEDLLESWREQVPRLARFIGKLEQAQRTDILSAIGAFLDTGLQHNRTPLIALRQGPHGSPIHEAFYLAQSVYLELRQKGLERQGDVDATIDKTLALLDAEVQRQRESQAAEAHREWCERLTTFQKSLVESIPEGAKFILADEEQTGAHFIGREVIPFLEKDNVFWGSPPDDRTAVSELERLRHRGASYIAFAWPTFWWLDYYAGFHQYLRERFRCILQNDSLIVFDLQH